MDLSVVILSYNTRDLLEQTLRTVTDAIQDLAVEVIVVDNASHDGSPEMVAEKFPDADLLCNKENIGFAAGNNVALQRVRGRHVMLLNSDTVVRRDTLKVLVDFLDEHPDTGAAGCKILNPDGTLQLSCRRGFPTPAAAFCKMSGLSRIFPKSRRLARYNLTFLDQEETHEVDALSGSCMVIRKEAMDQVGLLDEDYFFYGEDLDWCFRIREAGWQIHYVPRTEIIHFKGESSRAEQMHFRYRFYEAMSIFVAKHMQRRYRFFPLWLLRLGIVFYGALSMAGNIGRKFAAPLADAALLAASIKMALTLRYHSGSIPAIHAIEHYLARFDLDAHPTRWLEPPPYTDTQWLAVYGVSVFIWIGCLYGLGLYDRRQYSLPHTAAAIALGFAVNITTVFFFKDYNFSRLAAAAAWGTSTVLLGAWRLGVRHYLLGGKRRTGRRLLLAGTDDTARDFLRYLEKNDRLGYELVGLVGQENAWRGRELEGKPVLGTVDELHGLIRQYDIDALIFTTGTVSHLLQQVRRGWRSRRLRVHMVPASFTTLVADREIHSFEDLPLIEVSP
jgi:O-antigen biosynthesis protein